MPMQLNRRSTLALGILLVTAPTLEPPPDRADAIVGTWVTAQEPGEPYSRIEIYKENGEYAGRIIWVSEPLFPEGHPEAGKPKRDLQNPDEDLRSRPIVGLDLMYGFEFDDDDGKWVDGRIYDPKTGKEYRCTLTLADQNTLEVYGFIKVGFVKMGRDTIWTRFKPDAAG